MPRRAAAGQLERVAQHAIDPAAGEHRLLHRHLVVGSRDRAVPPISEYSPSLFSRTTTKSISSGPRSASGDRTPGSRRTGRRLMYCPNARRIGISSPQSET